MQGDLSNTEYYSEVTLDVSPKSASEDNVIPVNVNLVAHNPTRYSFGGGYCTDTGARIKAGITKRRVNQAGHHFTDEALLAEVKCGIAGEYIIPGADPRSDSWGIRASLEDEDSDNSNFTSGSIGGYYRHREGLWMKTYALDYLVERFEVLNIDETSKLLIPSVEWIRTYPAEMDKRIYATYGTQLQLSVRGASESVQSDTSFVQPMVSGKWIHSFANSTRVIARGAAGTTSVSNFDALPTSLCFFTGGEKTVRGYTYNVNGPQVGSDIVGGKHLLESSLAYEIRFAEKWSVAAFTDIGDAFDDTPDYKTGVGVGIRWRSPIGPVRLDFGHALDEPPGKALRLHLTIGSDDITAGSQHISDIKLSAQGSQLEHTLVLSAVTDQGKLAGVLNADFAGLTLISSFAPQIQQVSGALRSNLSFSGTLQSPVFEGELSLRDFSAETPETAMLIYTIEK